jgi:hypothetical protein
MLPKSNNPEHWHGSTGDHVPRHDLTVIHSMDQMYIFGPSIRYLYPARAILTEKHRVLNGDDDKIWVSGSGYINLKHIRENYKIKRATLTRDEITDCSKYLPKWWGKFICMVNNIGLSGTPNGGGLFITNGAVDTVVGIGCFEIRYNEQRIMAFTDLRYYVDWITIYANITPGDYYEYAYPKWSVHGGYTYDSGNKPYIPKWMIRYDLFPLGRK